MTTTTINNSTIQSNTVSSSKAATRRFDLKTAFLIALVAMIAGVVQSFNMFEYPYFQDSEGTNIANAWALSEQGALSPYTYDYEEAPIGTYMMTAWIEVIGGLDSFDFSVNTGRVLMLGVHVVAVILVYLIAKKLTGKDLAGVLAALIFAFSPLVTILQRRVLLDNLMLVWLLAAFYSSIGENRRLTHYISSAFFFALAVLTRASAFFFFPAFIFIVWNMANKHHQRFAQNLWVAISVSFMSMFPLYAAMRLELFPQGWWLFSGDYPHVSLYERIMDRGPSTGRFLDIGSNLMGSVDLWTNIVNAGADPILFYGGFISSVFIFLMSVEHNKTLRALIAMIVSYGLYLLIGGRIVHSAIIPMLPLLALSVGIFIAYAVGWTTSFIGNPIMKFAIGFVITCVLTYPFLAFYTSTTYIYTDNQTSEQLQAIEWVKENVPEDSVVVADNYGFVELRNSFPFAHHFWKVDTDPAVTFSDELEGNWCNIDYMITTPQLLQDVDVFNLSIMGQALENSNLLHTYENGGWPVEIRQVDKRYCDIETTSTN